MPQNPDETMEADAIANLLIRKGIISVEEFLKEMWRVKFQHELTREIEAERSNAKL